MTVKELYDKMLVIMNKYGDPSQEDVDFNALYSTAQLAVLKDQTYNLRRAGRGDGEMGYAFEMTQQMMERWHPLIKPLGATTNSNGVLGWDVMQEELGAKVYHLANVMKDGEIEVHYVRHNDLAPRLRNSFLRPTPSSPIYTGIASGIQVYPKETTAITATAVIYPPEVRLDLDVPSNNIDPVLPDSTLLDILFVMLKYSGVNIREQQFYEMVSKEERLQ